MARNLLILMSDEHRRDAMGCMGHAHVKTPHLDSLAARGTVFDNAYTPSPMCVPARAALATGKPVHEIGHWDSANAYDGAQESWMHGLQRAGYHTASIGKLHFRSEADDAGFTEQILPMHVVGGIGWPIGLLRESPPAFGGGMELARDVGAGESSYTAYDRQITKAAENWLNARPKNGQPWAGFISFVSPHYPLIAPKDFLEMYDPDAMPDPVPPPDHLHPEVCKIRDFFDYSQHFSAGRTREALAAYFGLISFLDDCVGRVLAALGRTGQLEDTLVIYASDHGDMMGDQGLWTKQIMYEASVGVPMILAGPGVPEGRRVGTGASLLDIAATAGAMAGAPHEGADLRDLARAPDDPDRTILSEYHDGGSSTGAFMLRWGKWKYVHYEGLAPQLFDLEADPMEVHDLGRADTPEAQAARAEGARRLAEICDPTEVNARCFADQAARIDALGGREACENAYVFNHTPTPKV